MNDESKSKPLRKRLGHEGALRARAGHPGSMAGFQNRKEESMKQYEQQIFRGGSWYYNPRNARVADRSGSTPDHRYALGLRLGRGER